MPTKAPTITAPTPTAGERLRATLAVRWVAAWMLLLAGLALGGKGTAYIGIPPVFISEVVLLLGCVLLLAQRRWRDLVTIPTAVLILAFIALGVARTLPSLGQYRFDALRDGVIYGYGLMALVVCGVLISRPPLLAWVLGRYRVFARVFLLMMPVFWVLGQVFKGRVPAWPWASDVPVIDLSPGDAPVHLGGIIAFAIVGLFRPEMFRLPRRALVALWTLMTLALVAIAGAVSRGGLVSFLLACAAAFTMRPKSVWARNLVLGVLIVLPALVLIDPRLPMPGRSREFSVRQLALNVTSVIGSEEQGDLDETKDWRLRWWGKIVGYTVHGEYFWQGKGFGINLADSDGFQVEFDDTPLRSPHNGHLTVLARMGVPGLVLWVMIQLSWLYALINAYVRARQRGEATWMMLFVFLVAYWLALSFNAAFDVYLEGPMGGVWFWSVIGFGLASVWVYDHHPEVLRTPEFEPEA